VWTFGEIVQPPDVQLTYGGGLWGALDFVLCQVLRETFGLASMSLEGFAAFITSHDRYLSEKFSFPSFIDNHDMNRFLFLAGNDERKLKLALLVLYCLPGAPIIYFGTEALISQNQSIHAKGALGFDEARLPILWDANEASPFPEYLKILAEMRRKHPDVHQQSWQVALYDPKKDAIVLGKGGSSDYLLLINRSEKPVQLDIPVGELVQYKNVLTRRTYSTENGKLSLSAPPVSAVLLSAES